MSRAWYSKTVKEFLKDSNDSIVSELTTNHSKQFKQLMPQQTNAWIEQIKILQNELSNFPDGHILFEYTIPRKGNRADIIFIYLGFVFVIEFKIDATKHEKIDIEQCEGYAVDLKNNQEGSKECKLIPILVSSDAQAKQNTTVEADGVFKPILCNSTNLHSEIDKIIKNSNENPIDPTKWENSTYKPVPTIIEAAQYAFINHDVKEIESYDADKENLTKTTERIQNIIEESKNKNRKSICFITGVPGSGKTLVGLKIAAITHDFPQDLHAVLLSGNMPLVKVLQEALARSYVENSKVNGIKIKKAVADGKAQQFIQHTLNYRDEYLKDKSAPFEKVVIFDEAQRAWDKPMLNKFMKNKKAIKNFNQSEPEFLLSVLDRHTDWCTMICLVGGGQEINEGEAGLPEWFSALRDRFQDWTIHLSPEIDNEEYTRGEKLSELLDGLEYQFFNELHLKTSIRSIRSDNVSDFVRALLNVETNEAVSLYNNFKKVYPIMITRDLKKAKNWLKSKRRGEQRIGLIVSSKGHRLLAEGHMVPKAKDTKYIPAWFLNPPDDVRSSNYLETVATEFGIQGLELDWVCFAWEGDLRFTDPDSWSYHRFSGTNWQNTSGVRQLYLKNAYRVLLTRARLGMVIFIPKGDTNDWTRKPEFYDSTYNYLKKIGIEELS